MPGGYIALDLEQHRGFAVQSVDDYLEKYRAVVQEAVPEEQVLAVGVLSRPGSMGAALAAQGSGLAYLGMNKHGKNASGGLPTNVVVAVTPSRVIAFDFRPKMTSIKLKGRAAEWTRAGLQVTAERNTLATRLTFAWPNGAVVQLDSNRSIGQYNRMNDAFMAALGCAVPSD